MYSKDQRRHITDYTMFMARNSMRKILEFKDRNIDQQAKASTGQNLTEKQIIFIMRSFSYHKVLLADLITDVLYLVVHIQYMGVLKKVYLFEQFQKNNFFILNDVILFDRLFSICLEWACQDF